MGRTRAGKVTAYLLGKNSLWQSRWADQGIHPHSSRPGSSLETLRVSHEGLTADKKQREETGSRFNSSSSGALQAKLRARQKKWSCIQHIHNRTKGIRLLDILQTYAPNAKAIHNPHSEAGAIYNRSFEGMSDGNQKKMRNYFYCEGIAPAESIPIDYGIKGKSTYSKADFITGWFASESNHEYEVEWVEAKTPLLQRTMFFADHGFSGATYKGVLDKMIDKFNKQGGFYVGNQR